MADSSLSLAELERLLDVHGTRAERWPAAEWDAALRLVASSAEARALWDDVAALDRMLDALPAVATSPGLAARVLAGAPRARVSSRRRRAATAIVPLAAAASVALWLAGRAPLSLVGRAPFPLPTAASLTSIALGEYTSPTDTLLDSYGVDVAQSVPSVGCDDSTLGCPSVDVDSDTTGRSHA